ncbi:hypothetical protein H8E07_08375 [bacterium]|nr:hypothetical protein [bacterium]
MKKMFALAAVAVLAFVSFAVAQPIDPDADGMSFYFDEGATEYCLMVDDWVPAIGAGPTIMGYLVVTNPNTPYPSIQAWEAVVIMTTNSYTPPTGLTLTPGAADYDGDLNDYVVGCGGTAAIPITGDTAVIATVSMAWLGFEGSASAVVEIYGVAGSISFPEGPGYAAEAGFPSPCQPLLGAWGPCAWINGDCNPIANEDLTWGAVKSLY